jgi:hypothetical protein
MSGVLRVDETSEFFVAHLMQKSLVVQIVPKLAASE